MLMHFISVPPIRPHWPCTEQSWMFWPWDSWASGVLMTERLPRVLRVHGNQTHDTPPIRCQTSSIYYWRPDWGHHWANPPAPERFDLAISRHILSERLQLVHLEPRDLLERNKFTDILNNTVETHKPVAGCPTPLSRDSSSSQFTPSERLGSSGRKYCCRHLWFILAQLLQFSLVRRNWGTVI